MTASTRLTLRLAAVLVTAMAPVAALGQGTEEQQQACTPDAVKLCSDTIPDIPKTTACMKAHFAQLSPRCQGAFNDATGGKPATKTATRKKDAREAGADRPEPRTRSASRDERRMAQREATLPVPRRAPPRPEREARAPLEAEREAPEAATVPEAPGYPPFPSPDAPIVHAPANTTRAQIANACRAGLIDSFTCSTTVPALLGGPSY